MNLAADNQQRLDAKRKQWETQDNRGWSELQNKANMLHKAIAVDNALQRQNKALSDTIRAELRNAWNTGTITKVEREGETPVSPLPPKDYKPSPIHSKAEEGRTVNEFHSAHSVPQREDKENSFPITDDEII
ncbi:hypothetical protein [Bartonella jaculi]|uniref:Uncharacterized protein n=1 Tax=Bartonella jaculi TaxID=686226 RepID=A0ABP9N2C2_9HYPH